MSDMTIYAAMAAAHAELTNPGKDGKANYGAYTTLAGLLDHARPILAKHGLWIEQPATNDDTHVRVHTEVWHVSGEFRDYGDLTWPMNDKVQVFGGLITYLRRYALTAALGLSGADEDDDGQQANTQAVRSPGASRATRADALQGRATEKQVGYLTKLMREQKIPEPLLNDFCEDRFGWELPRDGISYLTKDRCGLIIDALTKVAKDESAKVTRSKPAEPDPDDPWATAPLIDPATGEAAV